MDEFVYHLQIAGLRWRVSSPIELEVEDSCAPFLTQPGPADCNITYTLGRPSEYGRLLKDREPRVYETEGGYLVERTPMVTTRPCACVRLSDTDPTTVRGWIYPDRTDALHRMAQLLDVSELEILLASMGIVSLHSSLVRYRDEAILFTAPSGTGKSTQADLWEKYEHADILNGDRSLIRKADGRWTAYGAPFAGSSQIFRNESAPIRSIVVLRQAPENTVESLPPAEAFRLIYSESILPRWNTLAHSSVISIISRLCAEVPIRMLRCTPDQRAVNLLKEEVWGDTP